MSWKDRLLPASYRGVPFFVESDEATFGRRQAVHQAALVEKPSTEDLGRDADNFQVEGYLVGDDYDLQLQELVKAIRDVPGPGRLVHPRYGEQTVIALDGLRIRHTSTEGRMCRFVINFGEAGELSQPTEGIDSVNVLASRSEAIKEASEESFLDKFKTADFPQFVRGAAEGTLGTLGEYLATPAAFITGAYSTATEVFGVVTDTFDAVSETVSSYQQQVAGFVGEISDLVSLPSQLASRVTGLVSGIRSSFGGGAGAMLSGLINLFDKGASTSRSSYADAVGSSGTGPNPGASTGSSGDVDAGGSETGTGTGGQTPGSGSGTTPGTGSGTGGTGSGGSTGTGSGSTTSPSSGTGNSTGVVGGNDSTTVAKPYVTPSRAQIATNQEAIVRLIRQAAVAELAVVAVTKNYETIEEAVQARDSVGDLLDVEAEATTSDVVYQQLTQARAEVVQALPAPEETYARLVPYSPPVTLPALVIAQTLYGDGSEADQIVTRNAVRHPGFVGGGQTLRVLSNG